VRDIRRFPFFIAWYRTDHLMIEGGLFSFHLLTFVENLIISASLELYLRASESSLQSVAFL